ncbi:hypothetical protein KCU85_g417, partial [Aureobasidium melanogenum]
MLDCIALFSWQTVRLHILRRSPFAIALMSDKQQKLTVKTLESSKMGDLRSPQVIMIRSVWFISTFSAYLHSIYH